MGAYLHRFIEYILCVICFIYYICSSLQWIECLSMLCEVAFAIDLAAVDCVMTAEMTYRLAVLLESCAKQNKQEHFPGEKLV